MSSPEPDREFAAEPPRDPETTRGPRRSLALDFLRGVAILLVLGRHMPIDVRDSGAFEPFARAWVRFGWSGVDLFFVLSGFLIGGLLFNEIRSRHRLDVGRFLARRGLKIYPSYFAFMIGSLLLYRCLGGNLGKLWVPGEARALVSNTLSLQNYVGSTWPHTWSLAVEEHFYLLLPFVLLAMIRRGRGAGGQVERLPGLPWLALGLIVACTSLRSLAVYQLQQGQVSVMIRTHYRIDGLFLGVFLAYLANFRAELFARVGRHRLGLLAAGLALLGPVFGLEPETSPFVLSLGLALTYLGFGCILVALVTAELDRDWLGRLVTGRAARAVAFVGVFSYTTYLWHIDLVREPIGRLVTSGRLVGLAPTARFAVVILAYMFGAIAVGVAAGRLIERPTLALRDRILPARTRKIVDPIPDESPPASAPAPVETTDEPAT